MAGTMTAAAAAAIDGESAKAAEAGAGAGAEAGDSAANDSPMREKAMRIIAIAEMGNALLEIYAIPSRSTAFWFLEISRGKTSDETCDVGEEWEFIGGRLGLGQDGQLPVRIAWSYGKTLGSVGRCCFQGLPSFLPWCEKRVSGKGESPCFWDLITLMAILAVEWFDTPTRRKGVLRGKKKTKNSLFAWSPLK